MLAGQGGPPPSGHLSSWRSSRTSQASCKCLPSRRCRSPVPLPPDARVSYHGESDVHDKLGHLLSTYCAPGSVDCDCAPNLHPSYS